jgi:hypothetical protein
MCVAQTQMRAMLTRTRVLPPPQHDRYIGYFDELVLTSAPQVEAVIAASEALLNSGSFRKLLEIVLAFGNYMNSAKRGTAYGFKLATFTRLLDTKAQDRRITLLHYITEIVCAQYPQVGGCTSAPFGPFGPQS